MEKSFKKSVIWTNAEPPRNYLWAKDNKLYEYSDGWNESDLFEREFIPVNRIGLNKTKMTVKVGKTASLVANVDPVETTDRTVTWISSNPEIAEVNSSGRVKGNSIGNAIIYTAIGGKFSCCEISVV